MITAIDSSVILDVLVGDASFAERAHNALNQARQQGALIVCETVVAEICPALSARDFPLFFQDWELAFYPSTFESARLAGEMMRIYLTRGGRKGRVVADFVIGAHAQLQADRLLTRDRGFYRNYFKRLDVWDISVG